MSTNCVEFDVFLVGANIKTFVYIEDWGLFNIPIPLPRRSVKKHLRNVTNRC